MYGHEGAIGLHKGRLSQAEQDLQKVFQSSACNRSPTMDDRLAYYTYLRTGELTVEELRSTLDLQCNSTGSTNATLLAQLESTGSALPWAERLPGLVYAWTVDFHPSPAACNFDIYRDIGVVLHAEVDHKPFCEY